MPGEGLPAREGNLLLKFEVDMSGISSQIFVLSFDGTRQPLKGTGTGICDRRRFGVWKERRSRESFKFINSTN